MVVAIIGVLVITVLVSLTTAWQRARDAKRQSDIRQISLATGFYYDIYDGYPTDGTADTRYNLLGTTILGAIVTWMPTVPDGPYKPNPKILLA